MSLHPHERLLRDEYDARARRDDAELEALLADEVVWHVPGRSAISGTYRGKAEVMGYVRRRRALTDGTFAIVIDDVLANDRHGFVIATGRAVREGKTAQWRAHYRFDDGRIAECWVLREDPEAFDEIWR